ncbi:dTDP-4-keto-6-deoxy-D-glucose epimerase [Synechococcus sp. HB1133]|uniref:dTDP-4-dehydrorhamnose 3,5-epimerase family protein n=1 Tax=unclassified Synechococcus TaxID=2626047 RepID=UPI00140CAFAD|nr:MULTISPECIES: dTDP-4-dehydrorhamnose 3,5-epimerase family protein [unclassified Synechococcus]MCB4421469.1 dTDP-4-keto-6-deoxy-D-glucose epimerase [Synechococcus sp. HB1133]MCB4431180.1 dTDP-4-keto-6-deoxy-D-glucose epimerase [Synechococcus sp. HBA1120]NHI80411.1 dTDP-4-keto-6-deoxy-D-glucose epimerase [Synechococcus sp. HB1133]
MKFNHLEIENACIITPELYRDERGVFRRHFCVQEYAENGLEVDVMQGNISENPLIHTLRGFHFQSGDDGEAKTISCITGSIYNIIVDIRKHSKTYRQWVSLEISSENRKSIYVPSGCANAYLTMSEDTIVHYYMSKKYSANSYMGFNYNDTSFGFQWPCSPRLISEKDRNLPMFATITEED